jgi:hypothetical protein
MKKNIAIFVLGLFLSGAVLGQEYKVQKSTGRLEIREVNNVTIEGTSGNEIVFTSRSHNRDDDDRAKGLRSISSMGLEDNTGLGLSVVDKGGVIEVQQLKRTDGPDVVIKVPKGVSVYLSHTSPYGDNVEIKNFEGDLEVSMVHNSIDLINTTGNIKIKTVHGDIDASLNSPTNALSLMSVHGHVDVALPATTKANLRMGTSWGEILVDPDFKIEIDRTGDFVKYSDKVNGKLNGGGINIELASTHDNVYLRKK